ncbi:MAG TPA: DUF4383 domain-containing protein [Candidatus Thermoplasmatota archaeon]|nr:DUF4383 domain-containing protein [Candidatus Thermoplasmatota archaeon]
MTEYATPTNTSNPIMNPGLYWRVSAFALAAVALLGIVWNAVEGENNVGITDVLQFDWTHNIVHVVLAGAAFIFGFANLPGKVVKTAAIVFGVVYLGLGILGFVLGNGEEVAMSMNLEWGENALHLLLGGWGLVAGLGSRYE